MLLTSFQDSFPASDNSFAARAIKSSIGPRKKIVPTENPGLGVVVKCNKKQNPKSVGFWLVFCMHFAFIPVMGRKKSTGVNLAVIAKELNVSISTVSRAMRNADEINPKTRAQIMEISQSLGYDFLRRKRAESKVVLHQIMALAQCSQPLSDQNYLAGISRTAISQNLAIQSHHLSFSESETLLDPEQQPTAMRLGMVEGLIFIHHWPRKVVRELSLTWPAVSIIHQYPDTSIDHIGIDDQQGMWSLVQHLKETGHSRIGFLGVCPEISWTCSRLGGFVSAMIRMGLPYDPRNVIPVSLNEALSSVLFDEAAWSQQILACTQSDVNAWVCSSAVIAQSLCQFLIAQGIRIPEQVSVTGYHHNMANRPDLPLLTSTSVADEELGAAALRRLLHRFNFPDEAQRSILLPAKLVIGETTKNYQSVIVARQPAIS